MAEYLQAPTTDEGPSTARAVTYKMTRRYVCMVLAILTLLAVMTTVVILLGGRGSEDTSRPKGLPAGLTVPTERLPPLVQVRHERSSPDHHQPTPPPSDDNEDDAFFDMDDFGNDYKITRLTRPDSKYYSIAYRTNDDDEDRFSSEGGIDGAPVVVDG